MITLIEQRNYRMKANCASQLGPSDRPIWGGAEDEVRIVALGATHTAKLQAQIEQNRRPWAAGRVCRRSSLLTEQ